LLVVAVTQQRQFAGSVSAKRSPATKILPEPRSRVRRQLSCGDDAKGPRLYDWASAKLPSISFFDGDEPTRDRWVLARRSLARPGEIAYYFAYAPRACTVADWRGWPGWAIEECFQAAKNECGLDKKHDRGDGQDRSGGQFLRNSSSASRSTSFSQGLHRL
jgi:hypothetical protein